MSANITSGERPGSAGQGRSVHRVVMDTDLGSDVDDALALAVLLGSPEVELLGLSTVYGDVGLRARLAAGFLALAGRQSSYVPGRKSPYVPGRQSPYMPGRQSPYTPGRQVSCVPGRGEPLSGKPVWVSGEEGVHFPTVDAVLAAQPASTRPPPAPAPAPASVPVPAPPTSVIMHVRTPGPLEDRARAHDHDEGRDDREDDDGDDGNDRNDRNDGDGVGWLVEQGWRCGGELEIVAVGPLTNLACAVRADPGFAGRVKRVWLMGGRFDVALVGGESASGESADGGPADSGPADGAPADGAPAEGGPAEGGPAAEHNFAADAVAANEVLRSGLPITVLGLEITRQLRLDDAQVAELGDGGNAGPLGVQLERETRAWMAYWNEPHDVPHDAVAVIAMLRPDLFTTRAARVRVEPDGDQAGRVREDDTGRAIDVVTTLDVPAVTREILNRIRSASQGERCAT